MENSNFSKFEAHKLDLEKSKKVVGGIEIEINTNSTPKKELAAAVDIEIVITEKDTIKL